MRKSVRVLRKIIIALIGLPVIILGIVLIPLPGPGLIISFLGLLILSLEFDWAKRPADQAKAALKTILEKARAKR